VITAFVGSSCPDPRHCVHWMRMATGPWTCEHCHPREPLKGDDPLAGGSVEDSSVVEQEVGEG